jgi:hypothetical protein
MIGQYLPQTNETWYSVLREFKTLKRQIFHQLNEASPDYELFGREVDN